MRKIYSLFLVTLLLMSVLNAIGQDKKVAPMNDVNPLSVSLAPIAGPKDYPNALYDLLMNYNVDSLVGTVYGYGVCWTGTEFVTSRFSVNMFNRMTANWNRIDSFAASGAGTGYFRDLAFANGLVWGSPLSNTIYGINPTTGVMVKSIVTGGASIRAVTWDPVRKGFWCGTNTFNGPLVCYDTNGVAIPGAVITTPASGCYGVAYDDNPAGPFLWVSTDQSPGTTNGTSFIKYNATTFARMDSAYITVPFTSGAPLASGGCEIVKTLVPGKRTIVGMVQGTPDRVIVVELGVTDAGPLMPFNLQTPAAGVMITSIPGSNTIATITWDTSRAAATYKWIYGTSLPTRIHTIPSPTNSLTMTLGQLDLLLASLGLNQGDSVSGAWDVWAFRNNAPANDSLKSANGPRSIMFKRQKPVLAAFNLNAPANNSTVVTSRFNNTYININWTKSVAGATYKWKFGSPTITTPLLTLPSGFDTSLAIVNSGLDAILGGLGVNPGDSISGQWAVWAFNSTDSLKSTQTFNIKFKRQGSGDVLVLYDSTSAPCRTAKDSTANVLSRMNMTFDLFNRGSQSSTLVMSLRGYKIVILLGEGTSSMNVALKDSVKAYLNAGGTTIPTKSKLIIYSEDIGYNFGSSTSTYYDLDFVNNYLGWNYVSDRPGTGNIGLIGSSVNPGIADSTVGPWPDVLKTFTIAGTLQHVLYKFRPFMLSTDSLNGIGLRNTKWNVATFGVDLESLRPASDSPPNVSSVERFIRAGIGYVNNTLVGVEPVGNELPLVYSLSQNYPNPFNPTTKINFALPKQGLVTLKIYDVLGREVRTLVNEVKSAGYHTVDFDGSQFSSGVYFYRLQSQGFTDIKKMMLIK